jgi:hypothetical protein
MASHIKVETHKSLDTIFNLESFKYMEMKSVFHDIYDYLSIFSVKINDFDLKLGSIPNFSKLT